MDGGPDAPPLDGARDDTATLGDSDTGDTDVSDVASDALTPDGGVTSCVGGLESNEYQTAVVLTDGSVTIWGDNDDGQLGLGGVGPDELAPVVIPGLSGIVNVEIGAFHGCARNADGDLFCWGHADAGQVGDGTTGTGKPPTRIMGVPPVAEMALGGWHTCTITMGTGEVWCWGRNAVGQIAGMGTGDTTTPRVAPGAPAARRIAAGGFHTCAVDLGGDVWCWGGNADGQCGTGGASSSERTPSRVLGVSGAVDVSVGDFHSCALIDGGTVRCWGRNASGQCGDSTTSATRATAVSVVGAAGAISLFSGDDHTCILSGAGALSCWGLDDRGQVGDGMGGDTQTTAIPAIGVPPFVDFAAGRKHTCGAEANGTVHCWGENVDGQLGDGTTTSRPTPMPSLFRCP